MPERKGKHTVLLGSRPTVLGHAAAVGKKESEGPLCSEFDATFEDTTLGEKSWEKAESALAREAFTRALDKAGFAPSQPPTRKKCLMAPDPTASTTVSATERTA